MYRIFPCIRKALYEECVFLVLSGNCSIRTVQAEQCPADINACVPEPMVGRTGLRTAQTLKCQDTESETAISGKSFPLNLWSRNQTHWFFHANPLVPSHSSCPGDGPFHSPRPSARRSKAPSVGGTGGWTLPGCQVMTHQ